MVATGRKRLKAVGYEYRVDTEMTLGNIDIGVPDCSISH